MLGLLKADFRVIHRNLEYWRNDWRKVDFSCGNQDAQDTEPSKNKAGAGHEKLLTARRMDRKRRLWDPPGTFKPNTSHQPGENQTIYNIWWSTNNWNISLFPKKIKTNRKETHRPMREAITGKETRYRFKFPPRIQGNLWNYFDHWQSLDGWIIARINYIFYLHCFKYKKKKEQRLPEELPHSFKLKATLSRIDLPYAIWASHSSWYVFLLAGLRSIKCFIERSN